MRGMKSAYGEFWMHSDYTFQSYGFVLIIWNVETFRFILQVILTWNWHLRQFGPINTSRVGSGHANEII